MDLENINLIKYIEYLPSQENIDCCAASATLLAAEIIMSMNNNHRHFSRVFLYYFSRKLENRIGQRGTSLESTMEALVKFGVCLEKSWQFRHNLIDREPTISAFEEAKQYRLNEFCKIDIDDIQSELDKNIPVVIGLRTGRKFWKMRGPLNTLTYCPTNNNDNPPSFGHAVTIIGNMPEKKQWIIANSKGLNWGDHGIGILPYDCAVDIGEVYSILKFAGNVPI
jgi:C1A family cysteine protease